MNALTFNRSQSRGSAWRRISRLVLAASVLFAGQPAGLQPAPARAESPAPSSVPPAGGPVTAAALGRLPRYFVENRGQVAGDTAYTFRASGATVHFTEQGVRYDLIAPSQKETASPRAAARSPRERLVTPVSFTEDTRPRASVDLTFVGARMSRPQGRDLANVRCACGLLGWPASDSARLRHGARIHGRGARRRRAFMLTTLASTRRAPSAGRSSRG